MPVSGVVISCPEEKSEQIALEAAQLPGVEIHGVLPDGKVVAVIEGDTVDEEVALVSRLHELDGVISVRMAYHNFEDVD